MGKIRGGSRSDERLDKNFKTVRFIQRCLENTLIVSGLVTETVFFRALNALTRYMRIAYNNVIGCSYAIKYPYGESITTDLLPCFLAPDTPLGRQ